MLLLDVCYKAVHYSVDAIMGGVGARVALCPVPFPGTTAAAVLTALDEALKRERPRFVLLDHVSSQPTLVLPLREMVVLCRDHGVDEVAVDGAHAAGMLPEEDLDLPRIGADFYFTK